MKNAVHQELLTVDEVAARLKCHPHTVRRWIWSGKLEAVRVGDLVRVKEGEVERLMRPLSGRGEKAARAPKGVAALLTIMQDLRREVDPEDVEALERAIAEAEQPADWTDPVG